MTNEEAKQEAIKNAWGNKFDSVKDELDINGSLEIYSYNPFSETVYVDIRKEWNNYFEDGYYSINQDAGNTILIRPKELQGIGNNNGWIKIESDGSNLPADKNQRYKVGILNEKGVFTEKINPYRVSGIRRYSITHYKPIKEEPKPIY